MKKIVMMIVLASLGVSTGFAMDAGSGGGGKVSESRLRPLLKRAFFEDNPADFDCGDIRFFYCPPDAEAPFLVTTKVGKDFHYSVMSTPMGCLPHFSSISYQEGWEKMTTEEVQEWYDSGAFASASRKLPEKTVAAPTPSEPSPLTLPQLIALMGDGGWWRITGDFAAQGVNHVALVLTKEHGGECFVFLKSQKQRFILESVNEEDHELVFNLCKQDPFDCLWTDSENEAVLLGKTTFPSVGDTKHFIRLRDAVIGSKK